MSAGRLVESRYPRRTHVRRNDLVVPGETRKISAHAPPDLPVRPVAPNHIISPQPLPPTRRLDVHPRLILVLPCSHHHMVPAHSPAVLVDIGIQHNLDQLGQSHTRQPEVLAPDVFQDPAVVPRDGAVVLGPPPRHAPERRSLLADPVQDSRAAEVGDGGWTIDGGAAPGVEVVCGFEDVGGNPML